MNPVIGALELRALLAARPDVVVLDVRWELSSRPGAGSQPDAYEAGHVPGARFVDLEADCVDADATGQGRHPLPRPEAFEAAMRRVGVRGDVPVVCYDGGTMMAAARLWWLLTDAGHDHTQVLDGGWRAWCAAGGAVETGPSRADAPTTWSARPGARGRVAMDEIESALAVGRHVIDVRAGERFRGETEPLDPVAGHIPGAVNVPIAQVQQADGRLCDPVTIRRELSARPGDIFSCGSGITASLALLAYEHAGGSGAVIYPGSWSQWSRAGRAAAVGG